MDHIRTTSQLGDAASLMGPERSGQGQLDLREFQGQDKNHFINI